MRERSRKPSRQPNFDDDTDDIYITARKPRRATILDRLFPSMMRSPSFWITAGLIFGAYMIVYLFVKDIVIFRAPAGPASGDTSGGATPGSPMDYVKRVLTGFAGAYEESVVETKADGSVVVEQRFTVPTTLVDMKGKTAKVGGVEVSIPASSNSAPPAPPATAPPDAPVPAATSAP